MSRALEAIQKTRVDGEAFAETFAHTSWQADRIERERGDHARAQSSVAAAVAAVAVAVVVDCS